MECLACRENLTAYLDEELGLEEQESVEQHLGQCPRCNAEFLSLSQAFRLVEKGLGEVPLSPEIWQRVYADIARPARAEKTAWWEPLLSLFQTPSRAWATASLSVFLLAGSMLVIVRSYQNQHTGKDDLRTHMDAVIEQMDQRERVPHNYLHATDDEYYSNPFAPQHDTIDVNPFRAEIQNISYKPKERSGTDVPVRFTPASESR